MDGEMDVELEKGEDFLSQEENDSWEIWGNILANT